jgi:hypothetical protein
VCCIHVRGPLSGLPHYYSVVPLVTVLHHKDWFSLSPDFVGFVRSIMNVDVPLNIHESVKCAVGKQFVYVLWTFNYRVGNNKHISRTHMSQQSQQRMYHVYITIPIVCFQVGSEREEWYVLIKKPSFLTVVKRPDQSQVCIHSTGLSKNIP